MTAQEWNPYVRYGCISEFSYQKKDIGSKILLDNRLMYVQRGSCRLIDESNPSESQLKEGDLFYLPAGTQFSIQPSSGGVSIIIICFDFTQRFSYMRKIMKAIAPEEINAYSILYNDRFEDYDVYSKSLVLYGVPQLKNQILTMVNDFEEFKIGRALSREKSSSMLKHLLCTILQDFFHSDRKYDERTQKILNYIDEHFQEKITNEEICESVGYHPYYLNEIVKQQTGKTIHQHLVDKRLLAAKKMLVLSQKPINLIAEECGFLTQTHFSICFKKAENISPSRYRSLYANKVIGIV